MATRQKRRGGKMEEAERLKIENQELKKVIQEEKAKPSRFQYFVLGFSIATLIAQLLILIKIR